MVKLLSEKIFADFVIQFDLATTKFYPHYTWHLHFACFYPDVLLRVINL